VAGAGEDGPVLRRSYSRGDKEGRLQMQKRGWAPSAAAKARFLESLGETANITASAKAAGMCRPTAYKLRRSDPAFRAGWDAALLQAYEALEARVLERAMDGVRQVVRYQGEPVGEDVKYNDQVALGLLRMHRQAMERARAAGAGFEGCDAEALAGEIRRKLAEMQARLLGLPEPERLGLPEPEQGGICAAGEAGGD
jgi:hypothetical protein